MKKEVPHKHRKTSGDNIKIEKHECNSFTIEYVCKKGRKHTIKQPVNEDFIFQIDVKTTRVK